MENAQHDFPGMWYLEWDVIMLDMLRRKAKVITVNQTIIATCVVALDAAKLTWRLGLVFDPKEVARRLLHLKNRYFDFTSFLAINGISYDVDTNQVTVGQAYFNAVDVTENPQHTIFHFFGDRLYHALFGDAGFNVVDLEWMVEYFYGDELEIRVRGVPAWPEVDRLIPF